MKDLVYPRNITVIYVILMNFSQEEEHEILFPLHRDQYIGCDLYLETNGNIILQKRRKCSIILCSGLLLCCIVIVTRTINNATIENVGCKLQFEFNF